MPLEEAEETLDRGQAGPLRGHRVALRERIPQRQPSRAWAGVCPGNDESAGKRKNARTRKGNIHLKAVPVEAANVIPHTKGTYFKDKFFRLKARRGHKRAVMAAHKILVAAYHMLSKGAAYRSLASRT